MSADKKLRKAQQDHKSVLCLGLDLDPKKMPQDYSGNLKGMFEFAHRVIDATSDLVCAYKPNLAFYEHHGPDGMALLKLIVDRIPDNIPVILDGKRGDIGNSSAHYATALFEDFGADWITINPYMGYDSMRPFLERKDKGSFVLCLTSNAGSRDFQLLEVEGRPLYKIVAEKVNYWNKDNNCGLVVGATHPEQLTELREIAGDMPLLIPGVGAQGGSLEKAVLGGTANFSKPAVINVSRSVLYASNDKDFAQRARQELQKLNSVVNSVRGEAAKNQQQSQKQQHHQEQHHQQQQHQEQPQQQQAPQQPQEQPHRESQQQPAEPQSQENRPADQGGQPTSS
jgi:orotidine-5'-phosphate decarboxylase